MLLITLNFSIRECSPNREWKTPVLDQRSNPTSEICQLWSRAGQFTKGQILRPVLTLFESWLCHVHLCEFRHRCRSAWVLQAGTLQSCLTLGEPITCSPPGSSVQGMLQARTLEWVATPSSRGSSPPRDGTWIFCFSCIAGRFFTMSTIWKDGVKTQVLMKSLWGVAFSLSTSSKVILMLMAYRSVLRRRKESVGENGYVYKYGWIPSLFTRNDHKNVY